MALQTITSSHRDLQQILIYFPSRYIYTRNQETNRQWMDLDRLLVQLWESHAICTKLMYSETSEDEFVCGYIRGLLPEVTKGVTIELVNCVKSHVPQ